ncbi:MAG: hypothetical protein C4560_10835 [Nitrospiraceae bacterium]|nr:MAG: hypothetical protein C4560_10835 [Nitrospiraceae bacterium]
MDPRVSEDKVPAYEILESRVRQIDNTIIMYRVFYMLDSFIYRFQLIKKDTMCIVEIPARLLSDLKNGDPASDRELTGILSCLEGTDCWKKLNEG